MVRYPVYPKTDIINHKTHYTEKKIKNQTVRMHNLYKKIPLLLAAGSYRVINLLLFVYFTCDLQ